MFTAFAFVATCLLAANEEPNVVEEQLQTILRDLDAHEWNDKSHASKSLIALVNSDQLTDGQYRRVVSRLVELLKSAQEARQETTMTQLRFIALKKPELCKPAVPVLVELVADDGDKLDCEITLTLATIGPPAEAAVPRLRALCNPEHYYTAPRAAAALANIQPGNDEGVRMLVGWLRDERPEMRRCAAFNLEMCAKNAKAAAPDLRLALKDESTGVRVMAAGALWKIDPVPEEVIPVLISALSEPDESIHVRPRDLSEWTPGHRLTAAGYLGRMGAQAEPAVAALGAALKDKDEETVNRWMAAKALGQIGQSAEPYLQAALKDDDAEVRGAAQEALDKLQTSKEPPR